MSALRGLRMALVLGLLSAVGPFAIDMYLPGLPDIGRSLQAELAAVQLSLTAFFVALGLGQLVYGPLSDMFGRKLPLHAGMAVFVLASVGCALAQDIHTLIALRFVQGLGAAAGMAIPRAIVRDLHTGVEAARLMSLLMLVFSVSPILAPLAGSAIIALGGWRAVFWAVTLIGLAGMAVIAGALTETRTRQERLQSSLGSAWRAYLFLLRDRHFLGLVSIGGFAMAGFFTYLAGSSFVMIDHYGLSPARYSVVFGVNAAAFFAAAQLNGPLCRRFGIVAVVKTSVTACGLLMTCLFGYFALGHDRLAVLVVLYFVASGLMGLVIPTTSVLALEAHGRIAGTASALLGTLQTLIGSLAMSLTALVSDGRPLAMVAGMSAGAVLSMGVAWGTLRARRPALRATG